MPSAKIVRTAAASPGRKLRMSTGACVRGSIPSPAATIGVSAIGVSAALARGTTGRASGGSGDRTAAARADTAQREHDGWKAPATPKVVIPTTSQAPAEDL
jgi:hypothetical protein